MLDMYLLCRFRGALRNNARRAGVWTGTDHIQSASEPGSQSACCARHHSASVVIFCRIPTVLHLQLFLCRLFPAPVWCDRAVSERGNQT